ncbi:MULTISPECIES: histidine phosphatase family protein [Kosmotoga]|uniref:Phosphoglycerate mutase n=1 Tax=Kosmotoga olearia (strain ATCC BAA-1733 / DSM 21960 / TBF 19.5.1) TaxID=521045 RepID=C5CF58_KOSOT|nr:MULTISPECIES: histidine phosphatase family protein [Kosmotoga]ACR79335.1 Phosphoglycerate mutase [Kosmotoga olearia TBF 19.5.1]OAA22927.1 phosphoglycerate mutase [Kosmotoga sp. DU53]
MTKLYITRHGQTEWNLEGRIQGQKDSKLTTLGEKQAEWLGERLKNVEIDVIISSSSGRAIRTAEIIRGKRNIEIVPNDNLREIHFGQWEGQLHAEIKKYWPDEYRNFWNFPHLYKPVGGETFLQVLDRVSNEVEKIISKYEGKNILIVTHAVVLKALIAYFENKDLMDFWSGAFMYPTCLNIVEIKEDSRKIVLQGDISHYQANEKVYND